MDNPYFDTDYCVDRLVREYAKHPRMIIAIDFDATVFCEPGATYSHERVFALLRECQYRNFYLVLFTAAIPERYDFMSEYMLTNGIGIHAVNKNPIPVRYGNNGKFYYNLLLDDKSGLGQACDILERFLSKTVDSAPHSI